MTPFSSWAATSDLLVLVAIALLGVALVAHATDNAFRVRGAAGRTVAVAVAAGPPGGVFLDQRASEREDGLTAGPAPGPRDRWDRAATILLALAIAVLVAGVAARGLAAGRVPWTSMYEFAITGAASVGVTYLAFRRRRRLGSLGLWVCLAILVTLGVAVTTLWSPADDVVPVLDSAWLVVHVSAAIAAGGLFTVGFLATAAMLVRSRLGRRPAPETQEWGERVAHHAHLVAFPIWTFAVLAGAIWAENAWGRYWGWDPKETWAFITWVCYAAHLHAQSTTGWRGTRAGWLAVAGFAAFVFNFFGVNIWLPGLHSYAGV